MGIHIIVRNASTGATLKMDLQPNEKIFEIMESAAEFWKLDAGAYVLRKGKTLLKDGSTVMGSGLMNDDEIELIPDPEGG